MAGTTQYFGISYPTATDYVKDGASNMQTIATGFDSAVAIPVYNNQTGTSYTFVLADAAKTVTSNNAGAVTFTIPPQSSVAWAAGTTLNVYNYGAGAVTFAGGSGVTVTNTAGTVAQYRSAKVVRTSSDAWTVVPQSGGASGLTLLNSTTLSGTTVNINNIFSSTYRNYKVMLNGSTATSNDFFIRFGTNGTPDSTAGNYRYAGFYSYYASSGTGTTFSGTSGTNIRVGTSQTNLMGSSIEIFAPNISGYTNVTSLYNHEAGYAYYINGNTVTTTQYTDLIIIGGATMSGNVKVYGYQD